MKKDKADKDAEKKKNREKSPMKTFDLAEFATFVKPFEWYGA